MPAIPAWAIVLGVALLGQLLKLGLYGFAARRLTLRALVVANGLPSLYGTSFSCLSTVVAVREGAGSVAFALVAIFSGIVLHDAMRVHGSAGAGGRRALDLAEALEHRNGIGAGWLERLGPSLAERGHRPAHVAIGAVLGLLAGLGFGGLTR